MVREHVLDRAEGGLPVERLDSSNRPKSLAYDAYSKAARRSLGGIPVERFAGPPLPRVGFVPNAENQPLSEQIRHAFRIAIGSPASTASSARNR